MLLGSAFQKACFPKSLDEQLQTNISMKFWVSYKSFAYFILSNNIIVIDMCVYIFDSGWYFCSIMLSMLHILYVYNKIKY